MLNFPDSFPQPLTFAIQHDHAASAANELVLHPALCDGFFNWVNSPENKEWKTHHESFIHTIERCIYANKRIKEISSQGKLPSQPQVESSFALAIFNSFSPEEGQSEEEIVDQNEISHLNDTIEQLSANDSDKASKTILTAINSGDEVDIFTIITLLSENEELAHFVDEKLKTCDDLSNLIEKVDPAIFDSILLLFQKLPITRYNLCKDQSIYDLVDQDNFQLAQLFLEEFPDSVLDFFAQTDGYNWLHSYAASSNAKVLGFVLENLEKRNLTDRCCVNAPEGFSILHLAVRAESVETVTVILDKLKDYPKALERLSGLNSINLTPIDYAIQNGNRPLAELLRNRIPEMSISPVMSIWLDNEDPLEQEQALVKLLTQAPEGNEMTLLMNHICSCEGLKKFAKPFLRNQPQFQDSFSLEYLTPEAEPFIYDAFKPSVIQRKVQQITSQDDSPIWGIIDPSLFTQIDEIVKELGENLPSPELLTKIDACFDHSPLLSFAALTTLQGYHTKLVCLLPFIKKEIYFAAILPNLTTEEIMEFIGDQLAKSKTSLLRFLTKEQKIALLNTPEIQKHLTANVSDWQRKLEELNLAKDKETVPRDMHLLLFEIENHKNHQILQAFREEGEPLDANLIPSFSESNEKEINELAATCYAYFDELDSASNEAPEIFFDNLIAMDGKLLENPIAFIGAHPNSLTWLDAQTWQEVKVSGKNEHPYTREPLFIDKPDIALKNRIQRWQERTKSKE